MHNHNINDTTIPEGYTRVTDILKPFSKLDQIDPVTLKKAADRGTRVHKFCTLYALHMLIVDVDEDCKGYFESFKNWFDSTVEGISVRPQRINSPTLMISGEYDLIVKLKGDDGVTLVDLKTPATHSKTWQLQTAAYKMLIEDEICLPVDRRAVVQLKKDGSRITFIEHLDHNNDKQLFLNALSLHRFFNG
jgi:hypothetical protein